MRSRQSVQLQAYISAANNIENIGDMIETNIVEAGLQRLRRNVVVSAGTEEALNALHDRVCWSVQMALQALDASDAGMAQAVIDSKQTINQLVSHVERRLIVRLGADAEDRLVLYQLESELTEYLKRVYYFAKRIAKTIDETNRPGSQSRGSNVTVQPDAR